MKDGIAILLLAITANGLFCLTSATNRACINGNSQITKLICDGVDYTDQLVNRKNHKKCDCLNLPVCKKIAINAVGVRQIHKTAPGITFCQTSAPAAYKDWVCAKATRIEGDSWLSSSYDTLRWKSAAKPRGRCPRCHKRKHLPCRSKCFWNHGVQAPAVDCIREQCEDDCLKCEQTGPGFCDPGMCRLGHGYNNLTQEAHCNHQCRLDWLAWGPTPNPTGTGFLKLTDIRSQSVDIIQANDAGFYLAVIDMSTCTFADKNYTAWTFAGYRSLRFGQLLRWFADKTGPTANRIAVDLHVGGLTGVVAPLQQSDAPTFTAYLLGMGLTKYVQFPNHGCAGNALLTGINNGRVDMTSFEITTPTC